jgi:hypothetical protein
MADVVSEPLCVLYNNFGKIPKMDIINIFAEFYTETEITEAKKALLDISDGLSPKSDDLKKIKIRVGDGKLRRDTEDLVLIYTVLDNRKHQMPRFLAADSNRIPTFKEIEICKVTASIAELSSKIAEIGATVTTLVDVSVSSAASAAASASAGGVNQGCTGGSSSGDVSQDIQSAAVCSGAQNSNPWLQIVKGHAVLSGVMPSKAAPLTVSASKTAPRRQITGAKQIQSGQTAKISATVGTKSWHLFIGKLDKDTKEEDLKEFLEDSGISVSDVKKLKPTAEWQEKNSAFRVSVLYKCKDMVMNPDIWPDNVDVRDWFFKQK